MPSIDWYTPDTSNAIQTVGGSGIGFYAAAGFGSSISVGNSNERTFITNSGGTALGPEVWNSRYVNPTAVVLGQTGTPMALNKIPNAQATLNPRFTNSSPVRVQNATFRTYDRVSIANPATGVTVQVYECVHPDTAQNPNGSGGPGTPTISGNHAWYTMWATGTTPMPLTASPGTSGLSPSGSGTVSDRHDWYLAVSVSPDSAGSKLFAGWLALEYL